jgi:cytochrome c-type biogenesis protein CcmH/NrfG
MSAARPPLSFKKFSTIVELRATNPSEHPRISNLGRAYAMQGDMAKARTAYQEFLTLWEIADPDIPILKQAEAEYTQPQ